MNKKPFFRTLLIGITISSIITFSSCEKDEHHDDDHQHDTSDKDKPSLRIDSPTEMKVYYKGDTVRITGLTTDASLHEMVVRIEKESDATEMFKETISIHDLKTYTFNTFWKSDVSDHTNARVIVSVVDHSNNYAIDTVKIHIMP